MLQYQYEALVVGGCVRNSSGTFSTGYRRWGQFHTTRGLAAKWPDRRTAT